jgi:uncharacterized protein YjbI with pentapeptide repeats
MTSKNRFEEIDAFEQEGSDFMDVDFSGLDLNGSSLLGLNLRSASSILAAQEAAFHVSKIVTTLFIESDLSEANFSGSFMWNVFFDYSKLPKANFTNSSMSDVSFFLALTFLVRTSRQHVLVQTCLSKTQT